MMNRKKVTVIGFCIITFAIGLVLGGYAGFQFIGKPYYKLRKLMSVAMHAEYSCYQYLHSDYEQAQNALLEHVDLLKKVNNIPSAFWTAPYNNLDLAFTYVRLATLEKNHGNTESASKYLKMAIEECEKAESKQCQEDNLTSAVSKFDSRYQ